MPGTSVFPNQPQGPLWIATGATKTAGLDLLGLRLPVQVIGGRLLNGITTVTPTIRYLSLRTWLLYNYINARGPQPDSSEGFVRYARAAEAAFVLANLYRDPTRSDLIGAEWARDRIQEGRAEIPLTDLWKQRAVNTYAGPSDQLRLTEDRKPGAPGLGRERGIPLALAFDETFGRTRLGRRLAEGQEIDTLAREDLEELAQFAWVDDVPDAERECLIDATIPPKPLPDERPRVATYALLLELARIHHGGTQIKDDLLWTEAVRGSGRTAPVLSPQLDGWLHYLIRDTIAVTGEAVLEATIETLGTVAGRYGAAEDVAVVSTLVFDRDAHTTALQEVGLLEDGEDPASLSFRDLETRVVERTPGRPGSSGLVRWSDGLDEPKVIKAARSRDAGSVSLLLVSWLLAERRAGAAVREEHPAVAELSYGGSERFGLADVILPALERWRTSNPPLPEVFAEVVIQVVEQHLRIAWSRLAVDRSRDVALLAREGRQWIHRADYTGGRTASRIEQAVKWLRQLRLIDQSGLTPDGAEVLRRSLRALEEQI